MVSWLTTGASTALAILLVTAAPNGAKAQASAPPMIPPAAQAVAASGSSKGAPLFVAADPDLVAKEGVAQDSWFVVSHLTSGSDRLDLLVHYIRLTPPQGPMTQAIIEDNLSAQEASVIDIRALIMSPAFENAARFYQMFSTDVSYYGAQILVEGKKISRVTMSSVVDLLNALKKQLLAGEKHFLIACHGSPEGLLIRAAPGHTTTLTDKILDRLLAAADDETGARDTLLGTTDKSGKKLFTKESQVDDLLSLIKDVRGGQIELIEFRCCNLGAGAGLKKIHKLFGSKITAAPKTKYVFLRGTFGGKAKLPKSEAQWNAQLKHNADQIGRLPPNRRTFTSRMSVVRGRPPAFAAGMSGSRTVHWVSVKSVG